MRIPTYRLDIEKSIDMICVGGIDVTIKSILRRGGLSENECCRVIKELSLEEEQNNILNYTEIKKIKERLKKSRYLKEYILNHSNAAYDTAIGYLTEEGLCEKERIAIVDSGWIGTLQQSIERLVKCVNPAVDIAGYYFGMYDSPKGEKYNTYFFSPQKGIKRKAGFSNSLFEAIVSSEEGMTVGYKKERDNYRPILKDTANPNKDRIKNNIEVLSMLLDRIKKEEPALPDTAMCEKLFKLFMTVPSEIEVGIFGEYLFSDDVTDGSYKKAAADLSIEDIKNQRLLNKIFIVLGIKKATIRESAWIEGSAVKAYKDENKSICELKHIRRYKYFVFKRKQIERMIGVGKNV